ncbi:SusC/RagA family TonB-linked outer membrane protein [Flavisolibacter tropicus]|uniref:Collagen-binding protein n=1 Tax=Flavisolibacter tropicus TaxID=1492898 RepID=A0A172TWF4_9BACT|nr:TonB-dependent receptor [Flavisolibacter tropicus]ANE51415.1 collagen-binding protein [Flavisolibacter tropicus]
MRSKLLLAWIMLFMSALSFAQGTNLPVITGVVKDEGGQPLAGVSVSIKNSKIGTTTNAAGSYSIKLPNTANVILVFTSVGLEAQEVKVGTQKAVDVTLKKAVTQQDEVVVVAYSTQKKSEVVGSMTTVKPSELRIPANNLTQAFAGKVAGVIAFQSSGEPGADNADFFIRGVSTFGYRNGPLILIDNVEASTTDLARLQVDDVASFSIMKDATATALYGAKGANGVILIKTKEGKNGKVNVTARIENKISQSTKNVELADPVTYMELANEANLTRNPLNGYRYSKSKIENTRAGADPFVFPATDWQKMLLKDYSLNQRGNISLSGGGGVARYYVSGSMSLDNGILKVDNKSNFNSNPKLASYSIRSNVNIDLGKTTELQTRISGNFDDYTGPIKGGNKVFADIMQTNPVLFPAYYENTEKTSYVKHIMFGNYGNGSYNNPYAELQKGYRQSASSVINAQVQLLQNLNFITKGLSARGLLSIQRTSSAAIVRAYNPFFYSLSNYDYVTKSYDLNPINAEAVTGVVAPIGTEFLTGSESTKDVASEFYSEVAVDYKRVLKDRHSLSGTLVGIAKNSLNPGTSNDLILSLPYRNLGVSGRATYVYDARYAAEFNFGYNGSERFHASKRWGFFPSAGLGYTVSNEKFWDGRLKDLVTKLKLKATYGLVGNDAIGSIQDRFFYLSSINMNSATKRANFGYPSDYIVNGIDINRYANKDITWEVAEKSNVGFEMTLLKKLNIQADAYQDRRSNILMTRASIPTTMGLDTSAIPRANVGKASSQGIDLAMDMDFNLTKKWWVKGMANFTYATSKYERYEEPVYISELDGKTIQLDNLTHVGKSLSQQWGFIAERLFVDDKDAANSPLQSFGPYGGGDIKYRDINKDGKITDLDKVPLGHPTVPEIVYGFGFSTGYKGFDFSIFFQGLARRSFWIDASATSPFVNDQRLLLQAYADDHWSEENRNIYALWPRLSPTVNANNVQRSTWFMRDGSLLRIKQAEVGYTLPKRAMDKLGLSNARFYLNCNNLYTFSNFKLWDIEMGGNGLAYPIQRVTNLGVTISFK